MSAITKAAILNVRILCQRSIDSKHCTIFFQSLNISEDVKYAFFPQHVINKAFNISQLTQQGKKVLIRCQSLGQQRPDYESRGKFASSDKIWQWRINVIISHTPQSLLWKVFQRRLVNVVKTCSCIQLTPVSNDQVSHQRVIIQNHHRTEQTRDEDCIPSVIWRFTFQVLWSFISLMENMRSQHHKTSTVRQRAQASWGTWKIQGYFNKQWLFVQ